MPASSAHIFIYACLRLPNIPVLFGCLAHLEASPDDFCMTSLTVSGRVAQVLSCHLGDVFGVMGNGNVYFLDAAEKLGLRFSAVRHEGAAVAAADAYCRACGRLAAGTTTCGPGYTNALTALAEAVQAQIPVVLVTGDAPGSGARPQDVDQTAIAAGLGAATFTVTRDAAGAITRQAVEYALTRRTAATGRERQCRRRPRAGSPPARRGEAAAAER